MTNEIIHSASEPLFFIVYSQGVFMMGQFTGHYHYGKLMTANSMVTGLESLETFLSIDAWAIRLLDFGTVADKNFYGSP